MNIYEDNVVTIISTARTFPPTFHLFTVVHEGGLLQKLKTIREGD